MKKIITILSIVMFQCISASAQKPELFFVEKMALQEKSVAARRMSFIESENYGLTDIIYQRMEWEINPAVLYIKGIITTHFKSKTQNLTEIQFDLHADLIVDSVSQNNKNIAFTRNLDRLIIPLKENLSVNQTDSVVIYYQGEPPNSGFGSFAIEKHSGIPIIWTLSEPYGAMEWWPCKQSLVDKIDSIDIIVTSPEMFRTASNGVLISENIKNGYRKMHWKHRFPIATYLVAIAVTNYSNYSDYVNLKDGRQIEILNYVYPENLEWAKEKTQVTVELMELFNELIGEYPFAKEKYGHAQFGWGGGMEHQTMSFMGGFGFELISHELAHQWFGDYITLGTWQDIWLNEGFASYMAGLSYEHLLDGVWWPRWKRINVEKITSKPGGSVYVSDTTDLKVLFSSRLSYSKGAYLLHMLRWILGDENFYLGIQNYYNDPEIANGFANTNQFIKHMESAGDTSLTEFFNDWFYGEGFPVYSFDFTQSDENTLKITLSQATSHPSVSFFEMPVPVRVFNIGKKDSADFILNHTINNQEFTVNPGFHVSELKIDPEYWLISKTSENVYSPNIEVSDQIIAFPNPFTEMVSIVIPHGQQIISTKLFSLTGSLIAEHNGDQLVFNWSNLPRGTYIIQLKTTQEVFEKKLIKN